MIVTDSGNMDYKNAQAIRLKKSKNDVPRNYGMDV
jgi:hypothetical protein